MENLNRNFDITIENNASLRYQNDSDENIIISKRSSNMMLADVHSDSDGVLFRNVTAHRFKESNQKTNDFFKEHIKRRLPEDQLETIKDALIDLYLSVKIRTNDEIDGYNEDKLAQERDKLKHGNRVDEMTLIEYIKLSIEILMNMKHEDFEKETNLQQRQMKQNERELQDIKSNNSNRFMTRSQLSGLSRSSSLPIVNSEYEKIIQGYENEIRGHIKTE